MRVNAKINYGTKELMREPESYQLAVEQSPVLLDSITDPVSTTQRRGVQVCAKKFHASQNHDQ